MQVKMQKWGNSLGLRIPKAFAEETGVQAGSLVDISVENGALRVKPVRRPKLQLRNLLKTITAKNVHREVRIGGAVGKEVW